MTPQVRDTFQYKGDRYFAVAGSDFIGFNPFDYGIRPAPANTACWAGYWCEYQISEKGIILQNLYMNTKDDYYPEINHVSPLKAEIQIPEGSKENIETSGVLLLEKDISQGIDELLQCLENRRKLNETKQENFSKRFLAKIRIIFNKLSQSR